MMNIILNNCPETFDEDQLSISEIIEKKKFSFKMLVVKINDQLIKPANYKTAMVKDGDHVMILHLISGG